MQPNVDINDLLQRTLSGDRVALARAITLIESTHERHTNDARFLIEKCLPLSGKAIRVGVTGVPGVGKSTFIESLGNVLCDRGHRVAVLAVDPSGALSGGSILGDKTRMEKLATRTEAFIRPSASGQTLGGVARKTRESIILCEAAGFDIILVETVGVGQSETTVFGMVDFFLLLMLAGAGDELQGIKRGIMEMAHALAINKTDAQNREAAQRARQQYANALHLLRPVEAEWNTEVFLCSALEGEGVEAIWENISQYISKANSTGLLAQKRTEQDLHWFEETIGEMLRNDFRANPLVSGEKPNLEKSVVEKTMSPYHAAELLMHLYKGR